MKQLFFPVLLLASSACFGQNFYYGQYESNSTMLFVRPDGTYFTNCKNCLYKDTIYGTWKPAGDATLEFSFDENDPLAKKFVNHVQYKVVSSEEMFAVKNAFGSLHTTRGYDKDNHLLLLADWQDYGMAVKPDGYRFEYNAAGRLLLSCHYTDGLPEGEKLMFDENGLPRFIEHYHEGKLAGMRTEYYANGKIRSEEMYAGGMKTGPAVYYYPDGSIWYKGAWKDDLRMDQWTLYSPDGLTQLQLTYKKGVLVNQKDVSPQVRWVTIDPNRDLLDQLRDALR